MTQPRDSIVGEVGVLFRALFDITSKVCRTIPGRLAVPVVVMALLLMVEVWIIAPLVIHFFIHVGDEKGPAIVVQLGAMTLAAYVFGRWVVLLCGNSIVSKLATIAALAVVPLLLGWSGFPGFLEPDLGWVLPSLIMSAVNLPGLLVGLYGGKRSPVKL